MTSSLGHPFTLALSVMLKPTARDCCRHRSSLGLALKVMQKLLTLALNVMLKPTARDCCRNMSSLGLALKVIYKPAAVTFKVIYKLVLLLMLPHALITHVITHPSSNRNSSVTSK
jgi:hypothetical protein